MKRSKADHAYPGTPGGSATRLYHSQRLRFARMGASTRISILAFATLACAVLAKVAGYSLTAGGLVGFIACLAIASLLVAAEAIKVFLVILIYAPLTAPLGALYSSKAQASANASGADFFGGAIALFVFILFALLVSVRYSRGKAWVTLALTAFATVFPGIPLLFLAPDLGLNIARAVMALVLLFRCGGWAWISGAFALLFIGSEKESREEEKQVRKPSLDDVKSLEAWQARSIAEKESAKVLRTLSADYQVFHDLNVPTLAHPLGHLVVGPGGCALIASLKSKGPLKEDGKNGVTLPDIALDKVVSTLVAQRAVLAKSLKSSERDLSIIIVIHGLYSKNLRKHIAVFSESNLTIPSTQVIILTPDMLVSEVAPGLELWSNIKVKQTIQRVKMKLRPAMVPNLYASNKEETIRLVSLDDDGRMPRGVNGESIVPSWVSLGRPVNIATTRGILSDLRISGTPLYEDGELMVPVCVEEEWARAKSKLDIPSSYLYPIYAISPIE